MMKALKLLWLLLLMGLVGLSAPERINQLRGMELTVCPQGPPKCDFSKIQEAIDAAQEGATIRIGEGTYMESLLIRKSLRLIGDGQEKVRIKPPMPQKPLEPVLAIVIEATKEPIQVWIEGLSSSGSNTLPPNPDDVTGFGIAIAGWAQVILRHLSISGYASGVFVASARDEDRLSLLKPYVTIQETTISQNLFGISTGLVPVHIRDARIFENDVGIFGSEFLLEGSTIAKNRVAGVWASFLSHIFRQSRVEISNNLIAENGVGILLVSGLLSEFPPKPGPEGIKPLAEIWGNRIVSNLEYGVAIQTVRCPIRELGEQESGPIQVEGMGNEMSANQKGDLCPVDYAWPQGFKKP